MNVEPRLDVASADERASSENSAASRRAARAAYVGTLLEYYDFSLYASAASMVFASVFFAGASPLVATLQSVGTFAVGFLVRPVGGMLLGSLGDRIGRKRIMIFTLLIMGAATTLIGLIPSSAQIGALAPIALIILRVMQGIGASAEFGGATLIATEFSPKARRGFRGALPNSGAALGGVLGTLVLLGMSSILTQEAFLAWGWRVPFLISVFIMAYGLWLRRGLEETPAFERLEVTERKSATPVRDLLRGQPRVVLTIALLSFCGAGLAYFFQVFMLTYAANQLGLSQSTTFLGLIIAMLGSALLMMVFGGLSDRFGRREVLIAGFAFLALLAWGMFVLMDVLPQPFAFMLVLFLGYGVGISATFGPLGAFFTELLRAKNAYSGLGLGRETGNAIGAAIVPLLAVQLAFDPSGDTTSLSLLIFGLAVVGAAVTLWVAPRVTSLPGVGSEASKER